MDVHPFKLGLPVLRLLTILDSSKRLDTYPFRFHSVYVHGQAKIISFSALNDVGTLKTDNLALLIIIIIGHKLLNIGLPKRIPVISVTCDLRSTTLPGPINKKNIYRSAVLHYIITQELRERLHIHQ